ncbi:hypothetical protein [Streptomyces albireticuli]|uniref:hypothetical protein n=1 Tax=Streptomyces albireticuli TaxID=1940 RepID=UPI0036976094
MKSEPTPYEHRFLGVLDELRDCHAIELHHESQGQLNEALGEAGEAFRGFTDVEGITLDASLHQCFMRFTECSAYWTFEDGDQYLSGEFQLVELLNALMGPPPDLAWEGSTDDERRLYSEFRVVDDQPWIAGGTLTAMRITSRVRNPEMWFYKGSLGARRLDVDYRGYLDALLLTKGVFGWQYLFADVSFAEYAFSAVGESLREALGVLPGLFPDHDYTALTDRLAQRL